MEQAHDFLEECETLATAFAQLNDADWNAPTQFKNWTLNDVLVHLHFWNGAADRAAVDPVGSSGMWGDVAKGLQSGNLRDFENARVPERGAELFAAWQKLYKDMAARWATFDPKLRVKWVGPDMSVRSSMTARQMETWAHGQEVFDTLGLIRKESDRIRNIVVLGVNTFGWTFVVNGQEPPNAMPALRLTSPSGEIWTYGGTDNGNAVEGLAVEFAQVVTQTRNIDDTKLKVSGPIATNWMTLAQCFAGPPETPPAKGTRRVSRG